MNNLALSIQNSTLITTDGTMIKLTDPSKLHALGWKHKVELEEGIRMMYKWYLSSYPKRTPNWEQ